MTRLKNKRVFITGASSGIGQACAEHFAREGAHLIVCGRRADRLKKLAKLLIADYGVDVIPLDFDITDIQAVEKALASIPPSSRNIDILVNNAGMALGYDKLYEGNLAEWDKVIDTNIKSMVYMTRLIVPNMLERKQGHIINIGSISSRTVYTGASVYCATKFAVRGLTETLRMDVHGTGIRVSIIDPGIVKTDFFDIRFHGDSAKVEAFFEGITPLEPSDIADAVVYCATRPAHVTISDITIMPTDQTTQTIFRRPK